MAEKRHASPNDLTFSQRYDYEPLPQPMQLEELSDDLRREIWNHMRRFLFLFREQYSITGYMFRDGEITRFIEYALGKLLKLPHDEIKTDHDSAMSQFKGIIEGGKFNKVLDLIEIVANSDSLTIKFIIQKQELIWAIRGQFAQHAAAYWLDVSSRPFQFYPRSNREQGEATRQAIETIRESSMEGASTHLRQAAEHINAQQYGDSIADSIHAVESVARIIGSQANRTLTPALDSLEHAGLLKHSALKQGFEKLYGYTSDEQGIRHALLDKNSPDVGLDEAVFMFGSCASFAAYLVNKHHRMKQTSKKRS